MASQDPNRMTVREFEKARVARAREAAVESAREEIAKRRARLREIDEERRKLWEEIAPTVEKRDKLTDERAALEREIKAYSKVVDSRGKQHYADPHPYPSSGSTSCVA